MTSSRYRAEITGLRGVAILAVFVNHLNPIILNSGFLGVDIFFTISGFVIPYLLSLHVLLVLSNFAFSFSNVESDVFYLHCFSAFY